VGGHEWIWGVWSYVTAPRVQRSSAALMTASNWFLDGPSGVMTWTRARRRARSSSGVHWGAMVKGDVLGGCG
jgi:hypothetical protein